MTMKQVDWDGWSWERSTTNLGCTVWYQADLDSIILVGPKELHDGEDSDMLRLESQFRN